LGGGIGGLVADFELDGLQGLDGWNGRVGKVADLSTAAGEGGSAVRDCVDGAVGEGEECIAPEWGRNLREEWGVGDVR